MLNMNLGRGVSVRQSGVEAIPLAELSFGEVVVRFIIIETQKAELTERCLIMTVAKGLADQLRVIMVPMHNEDRAGETAQYLGDQQQVLLCERLRLGVEQQVKWIIEDISGQHKRVRLLSRYPVHCLRKQRGYQAALSLRDNRRAREMVT